MYFWVKLTWSSGSQLTVLWFWSTIPGFTTHPVTQIIFTGTTKRMSKPSKITCAWPTQDNWPWHLFHDQTVWELRASHYHSPEPGSTETLSALQNSTSTSRASTSWPELVPLSKAEGSAESCTDGNWCCNSAVLATLRPFANSEHFQIIQHTCTLQHCPLNYLVCCVLSLSWYYIGLQVLAMKIRN